MDRPHIICHMETSLNAKIVGPFTGTEQAAAAGRHYNETHLSFDGQAWLCGRVTLEGFTGGRAPELESDAPIYPREDYCADPHARDFVVAADPSGKLGWTSNTLRYSIRPEAHIIELLTERASDNYVSYLRKLDISYVFAGRDRLDLPLAAQKLKTFFGIETLVVSGGAVINGSFLNAGLIDELSIITSAVIDDAIGTPSLFERTSDLPERGPASFALKSVQALPGDVVWTRYERRSPAIHPDSAPSEHGRGE